jgi:formylmethanofuran dehydrogenase subunit E
MSDHKVASELRELRERRVHKAVKVSKAMWARKETRALRVKPAHRATLAFKVRRATLAFKVRRERKATKEIPVLRECRVILDLKVSRD